jgi:acyl-CoA reductase-like NAD-dependent aldehyde dehydrogenase
MMRYPLFIDGERRAGTEIHPIRSPFSGEVCAEYSLAGEEEVEAAIVSSLNAARKMRSLPSYRRAEILTALRGGLQSRKEQFARTIALEAGKPIRDARVEVDRAINVLTLSAEEAKRMHGETMPLDLMPGSEGRYALTRRFPVGPVVGITPYNFPLNLGMHKVAPALAAGNAIIWKPSRLTPGAAFLFAELASESGLPPGALNVITPPDFLSEKMVTDPRIRMLSFTGSAEVGWMLRAKAGSKKVALELGGDAAVIVGADADLGYAVQRCVVGGFSYAGQVCISVQRILIEEPVYGAFLERFVSAARSLRVGDPLDEQTQMGPMVSEKEAARVEAWIAEAVENGAEILTGGERQGLLFEPTVLTKVPKSVNLSCREAFGPVVLVEPFRTWQAAMEEVNRSRYGLQCGIFTGSLERAFEAFQTIEVGGLVVNDVPTYRMDSMPYGGVKESGLGREGVRYAIEEMTEIRLMALNLRGATS